ncbi:MAG: hypothetical protein WBE34_17895 [Candidatus Nitrosopolaris sp.]
MPNVKTSGMELSYSLEVVRNLRLEANFCPSVIADDMKSTNAFALVGVLMPLGRRRYVKLAIG